MANRVVDKSVRIRAPIEEVWRALVDPDMTARWLGGARVESTWEVGTAITFTGTLQGKDFRDSGTILAIEPGKILRYNHWSRFSRLPDAAESRSVITLRLESTNGETCLSVKHEHPPVDPMSKHSDYFWGVALEVLKGLVQGSRTEMSESDGR